MLIYLNYLSEEASLPKSKDDYTWMREWLERVTKIGEKFHGDGHAITEYGSYTALKLIPVHYYAGIFLNVASKPQREAEGFDGTVYVDLFAGSGLVRLTDTGDYVAGSVPCAISNGKGFDFTVCVELDPSRRDALEKRLATLLPRDKYAVVGGDCNTCVNDVVKIIKTRFKRPIVLTFVDPEGMEIKWETLETLSTASMSMDFIINVSASGVARVRGKIEKGDESVRRTMSEYYDESVESLLFDFASGIRPEQKYQEKINRVLGKDVGNSIAIHETGNRLAYYILGYTRQTTGGSGYINAFSTLKKRIEWADRTKVTNILDQIHGRTKSIM